MTEPLRLFKIKPFLCTSCNCIHLDFYDETGTTLLAQAQAEPEHALTLCSHIMMLALSVLGGGTVTVTLPTGLEPMLGSNDNDSQTKH